MAKLKLLPENSSIAFVSDYLPRRCGIATFTHDLCEAVAGAAKGKHDVFTVAMNDVPQGYPYSNRVRFEVRQSVQADYRLAAEFMNIHQVGAVCLQHEYGIFGGVCGAHILAMLKRLRRPLITTLHTILKDPDEQQLIVMREVARLSDRLITMTNIGKEILKDVYDVPAEKVAMVHHGIPDVPFVDSTFFKDQFGVEGRTVMLTFGLLGPGKGLEYAVEAMAKVVKKYPELVYIILGATHPHVKRENGEEYRNGLTRRVNELGLADNVRFVNRFVELDELCEYLGAADLYVTPYLGEAQITSGTLAYAMGAGKAVISTPYWYAAEMLSEGRGRLVPFRDSEAIADQILDLLDNENERHAMRKRSYTFCRQMLWKQVGQDYLRVFNEATGDWLKKKHVTVAATPAKIASTDDELPEVDLRHLKIMTDDTGILQHCLYSTPDRNHGYCTDDNARALIAMAMHWDQTHDDTAVPMMQKYLGFLSHALDYKTGRFRNFMNYDRSWSEVIGSEDSHGRALWALGVGTALCPHEAMIVLSTRLFLSGLPATASFASPRAWAFTIIGIQAYLQRFGGDSEARRYRSMLGEKIMNHFTGNMAENWPWCENVVTYANAKLPHALMMCGKWTQRNDMIDVAKQALDWLVKIQTNDDSILSIVGTSGWYDRGGQKARFDQQPIEAHGLVEACIEAYHITREPHWIDYARRAFTWFLGDNDLRTPLYDFTTGGCRDGLHSDRINENQGAESVLAWLMSLLLMHDLQMEQTLGEFSADKAPKKRPAPKAIETHGPAVSSKVNKYAKTDSNGK